MSKQFDLSTLNLSAGTHRVTVKARASGCADSAESNAVSYTVTLTELITFTIDGNSYTALSGMTWIEWGNSSYCTRQYTFANDSVSLPGDATCNSKRVCLTSTITSAVRGTDTIIANHTYVEMSYESGGSN